jgi:membrane-bound acyltransferase YfiQ involved in biofilm formation
VHIQIRIIKVYLCAFCVNGIYVIFQFLSLKIKVKEEESYGKIERKTTWIGKRIKIIPGITHIHLL